MSSRSDRGTRAKAVRLVREHNPDCPVARQGGVPILRPATVARVLIICVTRQPDFRLYREQVHPRLAGFSTGT